MKKVPLIVLLCFGLLAACSNQKDKDIEKAIQLGKDFKETVYTVAYQDISAKLPDQIDSLKEQAGPFLTKDELERQVKNGSLSFPTQIAVNREADVAVKNMEFAYKDVPDNTEEKINLSYSLTIELTKEKETIDEFSFDGRMRVEKREAGWKIDWDRDQAAKQFLEMTGD
ncbi:NTF2-like N-terminal transpeptidase domain-containing protein [Virgibacillus sp. FSP13]